jgi:hypothetical protein
MIEPELTMAMAREAERIEEDCIHSAKGHYEAARTWGRWNLGLGIPAAVLGGLAGVSAFSELEIVAGMLATVAGALTAVLTFLKPSDKASVHQSAGSRYNSVKNRARMFREIELPQGGDARRLTRALRRLGAERDELNQVSPEIPRPAFERARRGIGEGESTYSADRTGPPRIGG